MKRELSLAQLKAIFFDIDDTLYSTSAFAERARRRAIDAMIRVGLRESPEVLYHELLEVIHEFSPNYENHFDKLLLRVPRQSYAGVNPALITAAGVVAYHETKFRELKPFDGVIDVMNVLSRTDLIRGIITHGTTIKQAEKIVRLDVYPYLTPDAIFISDQIGIAKPNIKIYQRALESLHILPSEAVYVGDNPLNDVDPPNEIGMTTIRHRWPGKYASVEGTTDPDFEIKAFPEMLKILKDLGVPV